MQKITLFIVAITITTAANCCQEKKIQTITTGATVKAMQGKSNFWYPTFPPKPVKPVCPDFKPRDIDPRFNHPWEKNPREIDPGFGLELKKPSFYVPVKNDTTKQGIKRPAASNISPRPLKRQHQ